MARLLLSEDEDLVQRFRPHPASYTGRYLSALLWLGYGWLAWAFRDYVAYDWAAFLAFAVLAAAHATVLRLLDRRGFRASLGVVAVALVLWIASLGAWIPKHPLDGYDALFLGALVTMVLLAFFELDRRRRLHFLTTRRFVVRGGLSRHTERTLPLDHIETVHATQGGLGQMFGYATLTLLRLPSGARRRKEAAQTPEIVRGAPRWEEVKHAFDELLAEQRLSPKERQKRSEERRLKESMRAVALWTQQGQP